MKCCVLKKHDGYFAKTISRLGKDIIPQKNKSLDIIQAENVIKNYDNFAKSIKALK